MCVSCDCPRGRGHPGALGGKAQGETKRKLLFGQHTTPGRDLGPAGGAGVDWLRPERKGATPRRGDPRSSAVLQAEPPEQNRRQAQPQSHKTLSVKGLAL